MGNSLRRSATRCLCSARSLLSEEGGYSLLWWSAFFLFVMGPLLALSIEMGRYARAAGEVQKGADAAAMAATYYLDEPFFQQTGRFRFRDKAYGVAMEYANADAGYLQAYGIGIGVAGMDIDDATRMVRVQCVADVSLLLPKWAPQVLIEKEGIAEARMW